MVRIVSVLLLILCLPSIVLAQTTSSPGDVLTLEEAISLALQNNRPIRISALEVGKLSEDISAFRTHRLPVINVFGIGSSLLTPVNFEFRQGVFGTYPVIGPIPAQNTNITTPRRPTGFMSNLVAQPLTQLYKVNLDLKSLELSRSISQEELRAKQNQIRNQVTKLYYDLAQNQSALDANTRTVEFYAELDRVTDQFVIQQVVLKADSIDVKMRLAREQLETVKLANDLETRQEQMNQLLGRDIRQRFRVVATTTPALAELDLSVAQHRALEQRPEMREAVLKTKQAEYERRRKKAEYIPDVSLAFQQMSFFNIEMLPTNVMSAGLSLTWEPFDWGRKRHELAEKSKAIEQTEVASRETEAQILVDVNTQFRKVRETAAALRVAQLAIDATSEKLRVAKDQYRLQAVRLDQVLEMQAGVSTADAQYQRALSNYWTAKADLAKAMGDE